MEFLIDDKSKGIRKDGRFSSIGRALTILIGSKGGFCDITKGKTRIVIFCFISPSLILKKILFSKICFSFRFFYQNLMKRNLSGFQKKNCTFFIFNLFNLPYYKFS